MAIVHRHASRITAELGRMPVKKLAARDVETLLGKMAAEGLSTSTIRGCRSRSSRGRWTGRCATGWSWSTPPGWPRCPRAPVRQSRSMTTAQARQLLNSDLTTWWRAYFSLALYCGLRPGELTGLPLGGRGHRRPADPRPAPLSSAARAGWLRVTSRPNRQQADAAHAGRRCGRRSSALRKEQAADRLRLGPHYADRHDLVFRDHAGPPGAPPAGQPRVQGRAGGGRASAATGSLGRPGTRSCRSRLTMASASRTSRTRPGTSTAT